MNRIAAVLFLGILAGSAPAQDDPRLRELIQNLDDDSIDVRARAATALSKLDRDAIPALRRVAAGAGPERRDRIAEIIRKIEDRDRLAALLPPPSLITIEAKDRPLREVFMALTKQSRTRIDLTGVPDDAKVSVSLKRVPFWIALEEICRASGRVMAEPETDHIRISEEPYVSLPRKTTDFFRIALNRIDLLSNGSFGQPDRFEQFTATFQVSWEKGAKPWRVTARIEELVDDHGDELSAAGSEIEFAPPVAMGAIEQSIPVNSQHGPGPQALKISRLKVDFEFAFPLRYAEVRIDVADEKLSPEVECPEFLVQLLRLDRQDDVLNARIRIVPGASPVDGDLQADGVVLRDRKGIEYPATLTESSGDDMSYQFSFTNAPAAAQLKEIVLRLPAEIHRERVELDLKDIHLK